jgi:hypothetical protein
MNKVQGLIQPNKVQEFVETLSREQKIQIIKEFEEFQVNGYIGDSLLRAKAQELMALFSTTDRVVFWMGDIAIQCYKHFAKLHLKDEK